MSASLDDNKSELIAKATELAHQRKGAGGPPAESVGALLTAYYRHVAPEDVLDRTDVDLYGALASHYKLAVDRPQGTARVRVFTPSVPSDGWSAIGHSVVEVVTDDMPFLVDSITMRLTEQQRGVHIVVHPQFEVERDITGTLQRVSAAEDGETGSDDATVTRESWMHIELDRIAEDEDVAAIEASLQDVLRDVRESVEDWQKMRARVDDLVEELETAPPPLPADEIDQGTALLRWLADDHFTFLGYREYRLERDGDDEVLRALPGTGYGILRADQDMSSSFGKLPALVKAKAREKTLLVLAKANSRSTVHRPAYLDYIGVKSFDESGEVVGERRFLGLFSSAAYTESLTRIPLLREKTAEVLRRVGFEARSHAGKALMDTLENYPRDEMFQTPVDELAPIAQAVMYTRERRVLRLFVRRDTYGRYLSCLVYLPRDRYNTTVRERFATILKRRLGGDSVEFTARVDESQTARVHFVVRPPRGELIGDVDTEDLERRLAEASRSWRDDFLNAVLGEYGEQRGARLGRQYVDSFPEAYKEDFAARTASVDLGRLEAIEGDEGIDLAVYEDVDAGTGEARLKVYRIGRPLSLSQILPMLSSTGVEVIDERPYALENLPRPTYIYEFGLRYDRSVPPAARTLFQDALRAVWDGFNEIDGFNALVLGAGLTWRQATVLRAYAKYMRQGGTPFALDYIEGALRGNVDITQQLVALFEARFDPGVTDRDTRVEEIRARITRALDDVASLDHDRILRSYLTIIGATLRTNYFQHAGKGDERAAKPYISFKLDPSAIPDLPAPRPTYEIFVYSPRVEGVHLRFGAVARGGLRWSDRRDDFRTEVLGLVKA
ncbi:MAG: NAD-glutamate dehydrogenase, partial [Nocardioides sp.]|nr:NAD-glutamate dehydrogenase [Nocardioides sp.]